MGALQLAHCARSVLPRLLLCLLVDCASDMVKEAVMGTATGTLCQECPLSTSCVVARVVVDPQSC